MHLNARSRQTLYDCVSGFGMAREWHRRFWASLGLLFTVMTVPASAAQDCQLNTWLASLNHASNAHVAALDTSQSPLKYQAFRRTMERYPRERLLELVDAADLGENRAPLLDFISARQHLLKFSQQEWPEMVTRMGADPQFSKQSKAMQAFLNGQACDHEDLAPPPPPKSTSKASPTQDLVDNFVAIFTEKPHTPAVSQQHHALTFDADNFSAFEAPRYHPQQPRLANRERTRAIAVALGLFAFVFGMITFIWRRHARAKARKQPPTHTKNTHHFPVHVFDGAMPQIAVCNHIEKKQGHFESAAPLRMGTPVLITFGPVGVRNPTRRKGRVSWVKGDVFGCKFHPALKKAQLAKLLGAFSRTSSNIEAAALSELDSENISDDSLTNAHSEETHEPLAIAHFRDFLRTTYRATTAMSDTYLSHIKQTARPISEDEEPNAKDITHTDIAHIDGIKIQNAFSS